MFGANVAQRVCISFCCVENPRGFSTVGLKIEKMRGISVRNSEAMKLIRC